MTRVPPGLLAIVLAAASGCGLVSPAGDAAAEAAAAREAATAPEAAGGPVAVARSLYDLVSFGPRETPDWDAVQTLFIDEAVLVLRNARDSHGTLSRAAFVADFQRFIDESGVGETGFEERVLDVQALEFGDMAHVFVIYQPLIPGTEALPSPGVDSIQFVRRDGVWRIVSVVNDVAFDGMALPAFSG